MGSSSSWHTVSRSQGCGDSLADPRPCRATHCALPPAPSTTHREDSPPTMRQPACLSGQSLALLPIRGDGHLFAAGWNPPFRMGSSIVGPATLLFCCPSACRHMAAGPREAVAHAGEPLGCRSMAPWMAGLRARGCLTTACVPADRWSLRSPLLARAGRAVRIDAPPGLTPAQRCSIHGRWAECEGALPCSVGHESVARGGLSGCLLAWHRPAGRSWPRHRVARSTGGRCGVER